MRFFKYISILFFCFCNRSIAQKSNVFQDRSLTTYKYFIVNDLPGTSAISINKIEVSSSGVSDCNKVIYHAELYNVFLSSNRLILFTVLPADDGAVEWEKIDINTISKFIISPSAIDSLQWVGIKNFQHSGFKDARFIKSGDFKIIIKKPDGCYVNKSDCLTEFFLIGSVESNGFTNQNPIDVIDITNPPLSTAEFEMQYLRKNGHYSYNHTDFAGLNNSFTIPCLFYSNQLTVNNLNCYFFWELYTWTADRANINRGVDRFIFSPDVGIIGGDYTFYFRKLINKIPSEECQKLDFYQYMNNEVKLMPVKITGDYK